MDYSYDVIKMQSLFKEILSETRSPEELKWLEERLNTFRTKEQHSFFNLTFTLIPRFVKKAPLSQQSGATVTDIRKGLKINHWTADQLARAWWLLQLPSDDADVYYRNIETLFSAAEMNEQVTLYAALPLLAYPEQFKRRASEGVRTSLGLVFDAVALDNPYPSEWLEEAPWNQLVLKAFFMDKPIHRIYGLSKRNNPSLANILSDYAHERWAASRPVDPWLWNPVTPFVDEKIFPDILRLSRSQELLERKAAALVCQESPYQPARQLLDEQPELSSFLEAGVSWKDLQSPKPS